MNLIAYSDSEGSDDDAPSVPAPIAKPVAKPAPKPAFQKVVDRSNPGKIKLNLPAVSRPEKVEDDTEGPPAKKARTGGGAFSGFNSMLPAPKKANASVPSDGAASGKKGLGRGLGAGVSLKTGAEPAFKREPGISDVEEYDENGNPVKKGSLSTNDFRAMFNLPPPKSEQNAEPATVAAQTEGTARPEPKTAPANKPMPKFVPLSVARAKKKKPLVVKKLHTATAVKVAEANSDGSTPPAETKAPAKPRVSLFSMSQETEAPTRVATEGVYQPMLHGAEKTEELGETGGAQEWPTQARSDQTMAPPASNDLTNIAAELNLSEAERRQLFGRKGQGPDLSSAKVVEFNTDSEYAHNEYLRQQGETVQHHALKSISGTGKNSLRSLVSVATTQKEALEDHFAQGRRNKREAGNKYGF